jgi:sulfopyruvate decarboxylase TPP-binding subunit
MDFNSFWKKLCTDIGYHFFTGVPNESLKDIFNSLNPDILHFVPAVSDFTAIGLAAGVCLSGYKSSVLCDSDTLLMTKVSIDDFIIKYNIPILFITNSNKDVGLKVFTFDGGLSILDQLNEYMECKELPAILKI